VTDRSKQWQPASVSGTTKQAGDIRSRWDWVEASVWTDRMLTALETGVKGGKWFSLIDKVASKRNLRASFARVKRNGGNPGVDHVTIAHFASDLEKNLERLSEQLRAGEYRPQAVRRAWIHKPGSREMRPLGIPTVRDRVVQGALRHVLEPIFERDFAEQSYGFRPGRGTKDALRQVVGLLKAGATWVVDADWRHYFETISHERLMALVEEKVSDGKVLELIRAYLEQEVLEAMAAWTVVESLPGCPGPPPGGRRVISGALCGRLRDLVP